MAKDHSPDFREYAAAKRKRKHSIKARKKRDEKRRAHPAGWIK